MSAIWPWPQWVVASRGVPHTRMPPDPACAGAWQALVKSYVLCWVSPPPGKSQCGVVGLSRPHTAAGHHMRGASSSGITEPREPGEEAGAPAPWPFHLSPASLPLSSLPLWPCSLFLRCLCSLCTWPLFPAFPPALPTAPGCAGCLCTAPVTPLLLDPVLSSPDPQLPAPTLLHRCPAPMPDVPLHHLPPQPKTSLCHGGRRGVAQSLPQEFSICVQKSFFPLPHRSWCPHQAASRLTSFPGVSCAVTARHPLISSISLMEAPSWGCWWTLFTQWPGLGTPCDRSRDKEKCWVPYSHISQTCARDQCSSHTLQEAWGVPGVFWARGPHLGLRQ